MTAAQIIDKLEAAWPKMLTQKQWGLARFGDIKIRRKLADVACARGGNVLTPSEWHEISKWGINDDQSRVPDHRKDGSFRKRNQAASKGEPRKMWSGRLPERTHDKLRALTESGAHDSQADAIAAAVDALPLATNVEVTDASCGARPLDARKPVGERPRSV